MPHQTLCIASVPFYSRGNNCHLGPCDISLINAVRSIFLNSCVHKNHLTPHYLRNQVQTPPRVLAAFTDFPSHSFLVPSLKSQPTRATLRLTLGRAPSHFPTCSPGPELCVAWKIRHICVCLVLLCFQSGFAYLAPFENYSYCGADMIMLIPQIRKCSCEQAWKPRFHSGGAEAGPGERSSDPLSLSSALPSSLLHWPLLRVPLISTCQILPFTQSPAQIH